MRWFTARIEPQSAFGSALKGDMLFGQLCWAIRHRQGMAILTELLTGYTGGRPFLVVSDAFPTAYLPRPELLPPANIKPTERKEWKKQRWWPVAALQKPLPADGTPEGAAALDVWHPAMQAHNSISRLTATTGAGADPYQMPRQWPAAGLTLDVHLVLDDSRLDPALLQTCLSDIGTFGFGRDASIGLGRFAVLAVTEGRPAHTPKANAFLTLAPCAPQGSDWQEERCFYRPFTRFGRHGAEAATSGKAFKAPILLADTAAVLTPREMDPDQLFLGHGIGGNGQLSQAIPATVHQGYAPAIPVKLPEDTA